ncbi:MAG: hypothetical protein JO345_06160 [Streptosporangiaceae bacterium]|nr:hypothetical protein [Streptosporangiaceae bacterium]
MTSIDGVDPAAADFDGVRQVFHEQPQNLLIDRVSEIEAGVRLTAHKAVTGDMPYPYPGWLLLESWTQAAAILALWRSPGVSEPGPRIALPGAVYDVRFGVPLYPGDMVEHRVTLLRVRAEAVFLTGEARTGGSVALLVGRLVVALRSADIFHTAWWPAGRRLEAGDRAATA